jgi:hypothetical protein
MFRNFHQHSKKIFRFRSLLQFFQLFKEIFEFGTCGEIHAVWLSAGHLFVTLHEGKQLYTFDCKTVEHIQVYIMYMCPSFLMFDNKDLIIPY